MALKSFEQEVLHHLQSMTAFKQVKLALASKPVALVWAISLVVAAVLGHVL